MPPPTSTPLYKLLSIDILCTVLGRSLFHPILPWFLPLALLAQDFRLHHPPVYLSLLYSAIITAFHLACHFNQVLAFGPSRTFDWTEEVVLITGGASGLGLLIAEVYGMRGVTVAVLDKNIPGEGEFETRGVYFYQCNVADPAKVRETVKKVEEELGDVTVLINNAAVVHGKRLIDLSDDEIDVSLGANLKGCYNTIRAVLPGMISRGQGSVVTIGSVLATLPAKGTGLYAPTKAAVQALHHVLSAETKAYKGIKTLLVTPGQMRTPLFDGVETPSSFFAPVLEPVEVAKGVIAAVDEGRGGELSLPLFARWASVYWVLPASTRRVLRWWSGMDNAMEGFKGKKE
ncbi:hypothetical protein FPQ18DRAFT_314342 [Pyronema domesticum]|uniref:Similar to Uncharacterized oxidoreductase YDL114W acc. no. Q07530 n=1 Tax=Pyronema omphalodes (strain CBS 100304) TaxID=1076935 RepID=U4LT68_PYROM|nr:hypothetical protein FPQ18DRAFT_314342 [Pyronema domesticum]CCX34894.1 Similar to Uncharacterized oxidoreductase YDL114W; acc. no. Q07530 [Pyronema omphalodes CBS 100304]